MFKFAELVSKVTVKDAKNYDQQKFNDKMAEAILKNLPEESKQ